MESLLRSSEVVVLVEVRAIRFGGEKNSFNIFHPTLIEDVLLMDYYGTVHEEQNLIESILNFDVVKYKNFLLNTGFIATVIV